MAEYDCEVGGFERLRIWGLEQSDAFRQVGNLWKASSHPSCMDVPGKVGPSSSVPAVPGSSHWDPCPALIPQWFVLAVCLEQKLSHIPTPRSQKLQGCDTAPQ